MKQQIVRIHWWESKENYKSFDEYLNKLKYNPLKEKRKKWWMTFDKDLWHDYEVFQPLMPNKQYADYNNWKIMFEKVFQYLRDDVILIGHSMWSTFLCKYLDENIFPYNIKKIYLISWAFDDIAWDVIWNFRFDQNLNTFKKFEDITVLIHSKDDNIVPFSHFESFRNVLINSEYKIFNDKGHFIDETFPEIIDDIKNIK